MLGETIKNLTIRISASTSGLDKTLNSVKTKQIASVKISPN